MISTVSFFIWFELITLISLLITSVLWMWRIPQICCLIDHRTSNTEVQFMTSVYRWKYFRDIPVNSNQSNGNVSTWSSSGGLDMAGPAWIIISWLFTRSTPSSTSHHQTASCSPPSASCKQSPSPDVSLFYMEMGFNFSSLPSPWPNWNCIP